MSGICDNRLAAEKLRRDAYWARFNDIDEYIALLTEQERREFGLGCAERVGHIMPGRSRRALHVAALHIRGQAADSELKAAADAAMCAAIDALGGMDTEYHAAMAAWAVCVRKTAVDARLHALRATYGSDAERSAQWVQVKKMLKERKA